jgi:hypothetical protein
MFKSLGKENSRWRLEAVLQVIINGVQTILSCRL